MDILGILASFISGLLVALAVLVPLFLKRSVETYAEKIVSSAFDKEIEKYKANLSRESMAREMLLRREMAYYDKVDTQIAELVPLIQDLRDILAEQPFTEKKREYFTRILKLIIEMKDVSLRYQAYIRRDIWESFNGLVIELQSQQCRWFELVKRLSGELDISDKDKAEAAEMCDRVLLLIRQVRVQQADYLKSISGGDF